MDYIKWNKRETFTDLGLKFIKRRQGDSLFILFLTTLQKILMKKLNLVQMQINVVFTNPLNGETGSVPFEKTDNAVKVRMQLKSGQSIIVRSQLSCSC